MVLETLAVVLRVSMRPRVTNGSGEGTKASAERKEPAKILTPFWQSA